MPQLLLIEENAGTALNICTRIQQECRHLDILALNEADQAIAWLSTEPSHNELAFIFIGLHQNAGNTEKAKISNITTNSLKPASESFLETYDAHWRAQFPRVEIYAYTGQPVSDWDQLYDRYLFIQEVLSIQAMNTQLKPVFRNYIKRATMQENISVEEIAYEMNQLTAIPLPVRFAVLDELGLVNYLEQKFKDTELAMVLALALGINDHAKIGTISDLLKERYTQDGKLLKQRKQEAQRWLATITHKTVRTTQ